MLFGNVAYQADFDFTHQKTHTSYVKNI